MDRLKVRTVSVAFNLALFLISNYCALQVTWQWPPMFYFELTNERRVLAWSHDSSLLWLVNPQFEWSGMLSSNLQSAVNVSLIFLYFITLLLQLSREVVLSGLEALLEPPTPQFIAHVGMCHIQNHYDESMDSDDIPEEKWVKKNMPILAEFLLCLILHTCPTIIAIQSSIVLSVQYRAIDNLLFRY